MQRLNSILLIFIIGVTILPWQMICRSHLFGHQYHDLKPGELRPCEKLKQDRQEIDGIAFWPPMHGEHMNALIDDYPLPETKKGKPIAHENSLLIILFNLIDPKNQYEIVPLQEVTNDFDPPFNSRLLRGPPC